MANIDSVKLIALDEKRTHLWKHVLIMRSIQETMASSSYFCEVELMVHIDLLVAAEIVHANVQKECHKVRAHELEGNKAK